MEKLAGLAEDVAAHATEPSSETQGKSYRSGHVAAKRRPGKQLCFDISPRLAQKAERLRYEYEMSMAQLIRVLILEKYSEVFDYLPDPRGANSDELRVDGERR